MPSDDQKDQERKVIELVREAIKQDEELRKKHQVGDKFRFVRDRLASLLERLEKKHHTVEVVSEENTAQASSDEIMVFVYLYNAHGMNVNTWERMLIPRVFYEYSVNRPIYAEKNEVESLIRTKKNRLQHAYVSIIVKRSDLQTAELKDAAGNAVLRVREGALHFKNVVEFSHNEHVYIVSEEGQLIKKT